MRKPDRNNSKYYRTINRYGEYGSVSKFLDKVFEEDIDDLKRRYKVGKVNGQSSAKTATRR